MLRLFENLLSFVKQVIITNDCSLLFVFSKFEFPYILFVWDRMCSFCIYRNDRHPKKDMLFITGDWNAKVRSQEIPGVTGKFGLEYKMKQVKRNAKECSNYHTIALISYTSKVMLKILQDRLQQSMNFQVFKLYSEKAEEPEIKLPTSVGS